MEWHQKQIRYFEHYIFPIAVRIWSIDDFCEQAQADGISREIIKSTYSLCVDVLKEHHIFIPAEIVYFSLKKTVSPHIRDVAVKHLIYFAQMHPAKIRVLPDYVLNDREFIKEIIKNKGSLLGLLPEYKNDFEIVKLAVKSYAVAIQYAGQKLKDNSDIVKTAVSNSFDGMIFKQFDTYKQALRAYKKIKVTGVFHPEEEALYKYLFFYKENDCDGCDFGLKKYRIESKISKWLLPKYYKYIRNPIVSPLRNWWHR